MLTTILPGLRELRTPLATGYLWLVAIYLSVAELLPDKDADSFLIGQLYSLGGQLGTPTVLGILSFVAYLVGSVTTIEYPNSGFSAVPLSRGNIGGRFRRYVLEYLDNSNAEVDEQYQQTILTLVEAAMKRTANGYAAVMDAINMPMDIRPRDNFGPQITLWIRGTIRDEVTVIEKNIQNDKLALWDEYDRERAEASFRASIVGPLAVIFIALIVRYIVAVGWSWWLFVALLFVCLAISALLQTYLRCFKRVLKAESMIKMAVVLEPTRSPVMAKLHRFAYDINQ